MAERVGVYVCECGGNIAANLDVGDVAAWAQETLDEVAVARHVPFMCAGPGQSLIRADVQTEGLTRVVVAACSPHLHEKTFQRTCEEAGLNRYLFQMVNIREHVAWVTREEAAATTKAKALVGGAVRRVVRQAPLQSVAVPIHPATLVVGGGIAGIQAALDLADAGYPVTLLEREPSIGGNMARFDKTYPTLDCAACILTPKLSEVADHKGITLLTYAELESLTGSVGGFEATIRKRARMVDEAACTGCGLCIEKCPKNVVDLDFEAGLDHRKAIYRPFLQAVPQTPVIDADNCIYTLSGRCRACEKFCPTDAIDWDQTDEIQPIDVGNVVLATGWQPFDCRRVPQYGYGRLANVFTSLEFERMCNASGPTRGGIVLRDGVTEPESVAIIHCVGSRDSNFHDYCSNTCCMAALKFGHAVLERTKAQVTSFYLDMRTSQKGHEAFYSQLLANGMRFVRGRVAEVTDAVRYPGEEGKLIVQFEDTLTGSQRRMPVDMVILMGAMEPRADARELARRVGISCGLDGWFNERHAKLDPVGTLTDGVYIAGSCQGPKDIPTSVAQGAAAAARVSAVISRGQITVEPIVASIDEARCSGCRICNRVCPFQAITFDAGRRVSVIEEALCKGCGTCVAACPAQAIAAAHFSDDQLRAEIDGVLRNPTSWREAHGA